MDVDHLLGMFDSVYEDAFFKMWDDVEVKNLPLKERKYVFNFAPMATCYRSYLTSMTRLPTRSSTFGSTSTSGT